MSINKYINKEQLGIAARGILDTVTRLIPKKHNDLLDRNSEDSHPISAITGLNDAIEKVNDISIAQKTVNKRGLKELLVQEVIFSMPVAATNGTAKESLVDKIIDLTGSIEDYDFLQIHAKVNSATRKFNYNVTTITLPIVYNDSNTINLQDNSVVYIICSQGSSGVGAFGAFHFVLSGWFKTPTQLYIRSIFNPLTSADYNAFSISSIKGVKLDSVMVDPVEYINTTQGIEDTPVGNVISYMGKTAPKHYLTCDGSVYNITEYPHLSQYIKDQFGTFNYFGGNGTTTFAVPDLRNEFLRGYHGTKTEQLSGDVGVHQDATQIPGGYFSATNTRLYAPSSSTAQYGSKFYDAISQYPNGKTSVFAPIGTETALYTGVLGLVSPRPTNVAVLYCIKYEPTYFMNIQGMIEETVLWEGEIPYPGANKDTGAIQISLNDHLLEYDKVAFSFESYYRGLTTDKNVCYQELPKWNIDRIVNGTDKASFLWGFNVSSGAVHSDYVGVKKGTAGGDQSLTISSYNASLKRIVGIKYKTFQDTTPDPTPGNIEVVAEETTLWEGMLGTGLATAYEGYTELSDSLLNYSSIRLHIKFYEVNDDASRLYSREFSPYDFNQLKSSTETGMSSILFTLGYGNFTDYVAIMKTSTPDNLHWFLEKSFVTKIVGTKYKQIGGN